MEKLKKVAGFLAICLALFACNSQESETQEIIEEPEVDSLQLAREDSLALASDAAHFWEIRDDGSGGLNMRKVRVIPQDSLNYDAVIGMINSHYPEVKVEADRLSNDTLYLRIPNSRYLTQQMGSTGPEMYLKELTYNLTELRNIHYIHVQFPEGDHAQPGVYSRAGFLRQ